YAYLNTNQAKDCELCFEKLTNEMIAIGFITPLFKKMLPVSEVHCNATYKTANGRFELYSLIGNFEGAGYPLVYLVLDLTNTSKDAPQDEKRIHTLSIFFIQSVIKGIKLIYSNFKQHTDYSFLIWNGNKLQNESSKINTSTAKNANKLRISFITFNENKENINLEHNQKCELKIISTNKNSRNIDLDLHQKCKFEIITADENSENIDPELRQEYESKIALLEYFVKHLKEELSVNNMQHVENVVNNMKRTLTIIDNIEKSQNKRSRSTTWHGAKTWTMFL
ncbi:22875_t:CDS:2, partial [Gigaspora rosea]